MKASTIYRRAARKLAERGGFASHEIQNLDDKEFDGWGLIVREFFEMFGRVYRRNGILCVDGLVAEIDEQVLMLCLMAAIADDWS